MAKSNNILKFDHLSLVKIEEADTYLVCESPNTQSESYKQFIEFDKYLNDYFNKNFETLKSFNDYIPKKGEEVIARFKGKWVRGIINERMKTPNCSTAINHVYFCDFGMLHFLNDDEIYPSIAKFHEEIPHLSKRIKLANLSPISLTYCFEPEMKMKLAKCRKWDSAAKAFVENLKKYISLTEFECHSVLENGTYYGNLYFEPQQSVCQFLKPLLKDSSVDFSQRLSMGDILIGCEFAVHKDICEDELPKAFEKNETNNFEKSIDSDDMPIPNGEVCSTSSSSSISQLNKNSNLPSSSSPSYILNQTSLKSAENIDAHADAEEVLNCKGVNSECDTLIKEDSSVIIGNRSPSVSSTAEFESKFRKRVDQFRLRSKLIISSSSNEKTNKISPLTMESDVQKKTLSPGCTEPSYKMNKLSQSSMSHENQVSRDSYSVLLERSENSVTVHSLDCSSLHNSQLTISSSANETNEKMCLSFGKYANVSLPSNRPYKIEKLPSYLIGSEEEKATKQIKPKMVGFSSLISSPSRSLTSDDSFLDIQNAVSQSSSQLLGSFFSSLPNIKEPFEMNETLDKTRTDSEETKITPKWKKRGLLNFASREFSFLSNSNSESTKHEEPLNQDNLERYLCRNIFKLNLCNGCQGLIKKCLLKENFPPSDHQTVTERTLCVEEPYKKFIKREPISPEAKLFELIHSGNINSSRTCPVYYGGPNLLSNNELIFDERDMKTYLNDYVCNQSLKLIKNSVFITRLQSYFWPVALKGLSCLAIGGKMCGKTIGYLVPILSCLVDKLSQESKPLNYCLEPSVIIVCFGWKNVMNVADLTTRLIPPGSLKIIHTWGPIENKEEKVLKIRLLSGSDVLITTIPSILRLLQNKNRDTDEENFEFVSLKKCLHLVIDDIDQAYNAFPESVLDIIRKWNNTTDRNKQFIATSTTWFGKAYEIFSLIKNLRPNLLISSYLEAAVACEIETIPYHLNTLQDPLDMAIDLVQKYSKNKIVIFTHNEKHLILLKRLLGSIVVHGHVINSSDLMWNINKKIFEWKESSCNVMIVCDKPFNPLLHYDFQNADIIIQIGVPPSKYQFGIRYSVMMDNFPVLLRKKKDSGVCHLILNDEMITESIYILQELERMGVSLPNHICDLKQKGIQLEMDKMKSVILCHYVKALGKCTIPNCEWRHFILDEDYPVTLPCKGEVNVDIIHVLDASHYLVRIKSYSSSNERVDLTKYYKLMFGVLQEFYGYPKNRILIKFPKVGMFCAVENSLYWARAKVLEINYSKKQAEASVFLIDEGITLFKNLSAIYELPKPLTELPQLITEVYLCELRPADQDTNWTRNATNYISDLLKENKRLSTYSGKISFALNNVLWLSPMICRKRIGQSVINQRSLKSALLSLKFGTSYPEHMTLLRNLCSEDNRAIHDSSDGSSDWLICYEKGLIDMQTFGIIPSNDQVECANVLHENAMLSYNLKIQVHIGEVISPLHFYVTEKSNLHRLDELSKEMQKLISSCTPFEAATKEYCIALSSNGRFNRGKVLGRSEKVVEVFYIDYGKKETLPKEKIYPCPISIMEMPLQAYLCELSNILVPEERMQEATIAMEEIIKMSDTWHLVVRDVKDTANGLVYSVDLFSVDESLLSNASESSLRRRLISADLVNPQFPSENSICGEGVEENGLDVKQAISSPSHNKEDNLSFDTEMICRKDNVSPNHENDDRTSDCSKDLNSHIYSSCDKSDVKLYQENIAQPSKHFIQNTNELKQKSAEDIKAKEIKDESFPSDRKIGRVFPNDEVCPSRRKGNGNSGSYQNKNKIYTSMVRSEILSANEHDTEDNYSIENDTNVLSLTEKNITLMYGDQHVNKADLNSTVESPMSSHLINHQNTERSFSLKNNSEINFSFKRFLFKVSEIQKNEQVLHPQSRWKQDKKAIYLKFFVADVKSFECKASRTLLVFMTEVKGINYIFNEDLYDSFDSNIESNIFGPYVSFTLQKEKEEVWPRLLRIKEKVPWLHKDLVDLNVSEASSVKSFHSFSQIDEIRESLLVEGRPGGLSDDYDDSLESSTGSCCGEEVFA